MHDDPFDRGLRAALTICYRADDLEDASKKLEHAQRSLISSE